MNPKVVQETDYELHSPAPRLEYYAPHMQIAQETFADEILAGLCCKQKRIDSKFFYDTHGSEIFDRICDLSEYYLTRAETQILEQASSQIAALCPQGTRLVELGSGSAIKTRMLLEAMNHHQGNVTYSPIDISKVLVSSSHSLLESYDWLRICGVNDTYENGLRLVHNSTDTPLLIAFLGSSLGNMDSEHALEFLSNVRSSMSDKDIFLIGLDLKKDSSVLRRAYDDESGVTAELNFNLLHRINKEMNAEMDVSKFSHYVTYNESESRIETYLESKENQNVTLGGHTLEFAQGELVHTEYAHKYTNDSIDKMMRNVGLKVERTWQDKAGQYTLAACCTY